MLTKHGMLAHLHTCRSYSITNFKDFCLAQDTANTSEIVTRCQCYQLHFFFWLVIHCESFKSYTIQALHFVHHIDMNRMPTDTVLETQKYRIDLNVLLDIHIHIYIYMELETFSLYVP